MRRWSQVYAWVRSLKSGGAKVPPELTHRIGESRRLHSRGDVLTMLRASCLGRLTPFVYGDGTLSSLPAAVWSDILAWSDVDKCEYIRDARTCSNFALALAGQVALRCGIDGCGVVVDGSGNHSYNVLLTHDGTSSALGIVVVEPQSDRVVSSIMGTGMYAAESGYVLFA